MPDSSGCFNVLSNRFTFFRWNRCSCVYADMKCLFLFTYDRMSSRTTLQIMLEGSCKSLTMTLMNIPRFVSIRHCTSCTNCDDLLLLEWPMLELWLLFVSCFVHISVGDVQLLPNFVHKRPGDVQKHAVSTPLCFVCIATIISSDFISCVNE